MEFYRKIPLQIDIELLKQEMTIANLCQYCASIDSIIADHGNHGLVYCLWGQFDVNREVIKSGIRFSLPHCPNALVWTITSEQDDANHTLVLHCTINKDKHDPDFIESIDMFLDDWQQGLNKNLKALL